MARLPGILFTLMILLFSSPSKAEENDMFATKAPAKSLESQLLLKTNILPWALAIPNMGGEITFGHKWSVDLELLYCPWKITDRFSVKTISILPECRWWLKTNEKGSFFNLHFNLAWFNVRGDEYRYQDTRRPLLGAGIGYGYRLPLNRHWAFEFEIGAGMANTRYDRYYNVPNGALKDSRVSTYWGIDRAGVSLTYYICDL